MTTKKFKRLCSIAMSELQELRILFSNSHLHETFEKYAVVTDKAVRELISIARFETVSRVTVFQVRHVNRILRELAKFYRLISKAPRDSDE